MSKRSEWPLISIITPSYNQGQYLEQTIKSVVEQNYPNLEYLILDGGSTDNSLQIIKKYACQYPKIITWRSEKDNGQVDAINEGIKKATGDILAYLNSDDYYMPGTFRQVARAFTGNPAKLWLAGYCQMTGEGLTKWMVRLYTNLWLNFYSYNLLLVLNCISQPAVFWRSKTVRRIGGLNTRFRLAFDYEYWLRLGKVSEPIVLKRLLAVFRVHRQSLSTKYYVQQFKEEFQAASNHTSNKLLLALHKFHLSCLVTPAYFMISVSTRLR